MRFVIFGGGCYGTFYARQLLRAHEKGISVSEIVIVDHNESPAARNTINSPIARFVKQEWDDFCDVYFGTLSADAADQIVPPPFTPHLALAWLLRRLPKDRPDLRWSLEPVRRFPGTPFQQQNPGGPVTLSHADWMCPVHCVEPEICPVTKGDRYWDMAGTVKKWTHALSDAGQAVAQTHLFQCLHYTHGVGTYPAAKVVAARAAIASVQAPSEPPLRFLVGTVSRCHGAVNLLTATRGTDTVSQSDFTAHEPKR
jgi:hypothetical protein